MKKFVGPRGSGGRKRELTDGFLRLQSHYLFKEHFCLVRKANEKGHVENLVGSTRRNFLVPLPSVRSFDELNDLLDRGCRAELDRQLRGKDGTKGHRLDEERSHFRDFRGRGLPRDEFAACRVELRQANTLSLVRFDRNDYSVSVRWAHHKVTVIGDCRRVRMMCRDEVVATHPRDWGREQVRYDSVHYLALLERRPVAVDFAAPLEQWDLPPCFGILRRKLESDWPTPGSTPGRGRVIPGAKGYLNGTTQFIQVLRLLEHATLGELKAAVQKALELGTVTPDAVRVILEGQRDRPLAVQPRGPAASQPCLCGPAGLGYLRRVIAIDWGNFRGCSMSAEQSTVLLEHHLKTLKLPTMLREYAKVAATCSKQNVAHAGFLAQLAELELIERERRAAERWLKAARFPAHKTLDGFDFAAQPSINKTLVSELARSVYLDHRENILLAGSPGTGKTHLATALGVEACVRGKKVRFFRVTELITQMMEAREERVLARLKAQLAKLDLLILDELGYVPASKLGAELLFDVISAAYERTSILVTTNLPFERWIEVLGCERFTGATLDRLTHRCHVLEANGQSYRLNDAKQRRQAKPSK
ncbi:MAG: IS21-like element helper ATPase IstB [Planctomycetota bacterium]